MIVGSRFAEEGLNALGISDESDAVRKRITSRRNSEVTRVKTRLMGIALIAGICVPVAFAASDAASPAPASGPATYSARTDQRVEPYPKTPPVMGPAGSIIKDPSFDSRILRGPPPAIDATFSLAFRPARQGSLQPVFRSRL